MGVFALLGVQLALFSPAKYGILPEILPHERLSAGNGLLEMGSNLAILSGIVAGGVILAAASCSTGRSGPAGCSSRLLGLRPAGRLDGPAGQGRTCRGGAGRDGGIALESIRADRILKLTLIGQILVWAIASLVPAPILPYASKVLKLAELAAGLPLAALGIGIGVGCVLAGKISGAKVEYGLLPLGALGLTAGTLAFAHHRSRYHGDHDHHDAPGDLQRMPVRPARTPCCNGGRRPIAAGRSSPSRTPWSIPGC